MTVSGKRDPGFDDRGFDDRGFDDRGFDDHLGLLSRDLSGVRLVALHGVSGSGKSTAIARLLEVHPAFRDRPCCHVTGPGIDWRRLDLPAELVVVDECTALRDLLGLLRLLGRGHRVLAASHLPLASSAALGLRWPVVALPTDRDPAKIERYLAARGADFSAERVRALCARFGASYAWVDLILGFDGGLDFDRAYDRFERCCKVETRPAGLTEAPPRSILPVRFGRPVR